MALNETKQDILRVNKKIREYFYIPCLPWF